MAIALTALLVALQLFSIWAVRVGRFVDTSSGSLAVNVVLVATGSLIYAFFNYVIASACSERTAFSWSWKLFWPSVAGLAARPLILSASMLGVVEFDTWSALSSTLGLLLSAILLTWLLALRRAAVPTHGGGLALQLLALVTVLGLITGSLDLINAALSLPAPIPSLLAAHSTGSFYAEPIVSVVFGMLIVHLSNSSASSSNAAAQQAVAADVE